MTNKENEFWGTQLIDKIILIVKYTNDLNMVLEELENIKKDLKQNK